MSHHSRATGALRAGRRRTSCSATAFIGAVAASALTTPAAFAQTDFYNTDAGRPVSVEDAYPIEQRALELQLAPLRLSRAARGIYTWGIEPEVAIGLLPRTQFEIGLPLAFIDRGAGRRSAGLAGIELAALHNLNVETSIPALAVAAEMLLPVGGLAPDRGYPSIKGIATKTFSWARFHVNWGYTLGDRIADTGDEADGAPELSRWMSGVAVDRTFPLRSLLLTAELVARQPLVVATDVQWETAAGARYQLTPRIAVDGGAGVRLTGEPEWFATFGAALSVGLPWRP